MHGIYDGPIPAAVVYPSSTAEVAAVLRFAEENLVNVVPRTGRTATEGGLETVIEDSLVVDGSRMNAILSIDPVNMMATAQCGVGLQRLEDTLRAQGLTTGHSPQSKPLAQLGGLVATRSIGQFSTLYGGIEDMVVGLEAVFPGGKVTRIKNVPRRAAGPDIRHIVIGSEGALCFITEVTVKLFRYQPENNRYFGFLVDRVRRRRRALLRELITAGYRPSVCRVYSPEDARQHFADLSRGRTSSCSSPRARRASPTPPRRRSRICSPAAPTSASSGGLIRHWFENLNWGQDKIDAEKADMLSHAHLGYTTEVSVDWSRAGDLFDAVMTPDPRRVPAGRRPDHARRAFLAQLPDRHQSVLRLRLHDQLQPPRGDRGLPQAAERHHRHRGPADGRVDGAPPRNRQVPHGLGSARNTAAPTTCCPPSSRRSTPRAS